MSPLTKFCFQLVTWKKLETLEGIVHQNNFFKHFLHSCCKFKLLSTAGYSFFSKITRITSKWSAFVINLQYCKIKISWQCKRKEH